MLELILPWPPSVNSYKKVGALTKTRTGKLYQHRVNTNETKMFYFEVYQRVKDLMPMEGFKFHRDGTIAIGMTVSLHPPHQKRYDIDNRLKVLLDSLMHARVIADDSQICRLFVQKLGMIEGGQVIVQLYELEGKALCT